MTIAESLSTINAYPIPVGRRELICIECGLTSEQEATSEALNSKDYARAKARVYQYLATAPNVTENGITYSFSESDKKRFLKIASDILAENGLNGGNTYGYKGEDL